MKGSEQEIRLPAAQNGTRPLALVQSLQLPALGLTDFLYRGVTTIGTRPGGNATRAGRADGARRPQPPPLLGRGRQQGLSEGFQRGCRVRSRVETGAPLSMAGIMPVPERTRTSPGASPWARRASCSNPMKRREGGRGYPILIKIQILLVGVLRGAPCQYLQLPSAPVHPSPELVVMSWGGQAARAAVPQWEGRGRRQRSCAILTALSKSVPVVVPSCSVLAVFTLD